MAAMVIALIWPLLASLSAEPLAAQRGRPWGGTIEIWNSNYFGLDRGHYNYKFTVDFSNATSTRGGALTPVENLVITTNHGDITFHETINGSNSMRFVDAMLYTNAPIRELAILEVTCYHRGQIYYLTDLFRVRRFVPVDIWIE